MIAVLSPKRAIQTIPFRSRQHTTPGSCLLAKACHQTVVINLFATFLSLITRAFRRLPLSLERTNQNNAVILLYSQTRASRLILQLKES